MATYWPKNVNFPTPLLLNTLIQGNPIAFWDEPYTAKTAVLELTVSDNFVTLACFILA